MFVEYVSFPAAFLAGMLSFFSPCVLPLLPSYFSFICGSSLDELTDSRSAALRSKVLLSTALFVTGFSAVFILLGASASLLGQVIGSHREPLRLVGGAVIIVLGIHLTGLLRIRSLEMEKRVHLKQRPFKILGAFLIGMAFAAGWSPCIGPLLGAILIIAGNQDTVGQGILLLSTYSLGLALPFILFSLCIDRLLRVLSRMKRVIMYLNPAAGIVLILVGVLLLTDNLNRVAGYLQDIL